MQNLFIDTSLDKVFTKSTGRARGSHPKIQSKSSYQVWAPPLFWGSWVEIYAQFGVIGPNPEKHVTKVYVSFDSNTQTPSAFEVEIEGGDTLVSDSGPGSTIVTITGNVATALRLRAKSYSFAQNIIVSAS